MSTGSSAPTTYPFRPFILALPDIKQVDELYLDTGMVLLAADPPMTGRQLMGADKLLLLVAFPEDLNACYEVYGEFMLGAFDETGGHISISLFPNNEVSESLQAFSVTVPVEFVNRVMTRYEGDESVPE